MQVKWSRITKLRNQGTRTKEYVQKNITTLLVHERHIGLLFLRHSTSQEDYGLKD